MPKPTKNLRIELFFKDEPDLRSRIQYLSSNGISAFNIVNKNNQDTLQEWVSVIREENPSCDICVHYSAKYNKSRKKDGAFDLFKTFMENMDKTEGKNEVLLITGSGAKGQFNSLTGLQHIQKSYKTPLAVAFNPFFPHEEDLEAERTRLRSKLATKHVAKVYFQFGSDLRRLQDSLEWLATLRSEYDFQICGSIFLPTKRLISQQKFRPWNGVFLNEEFLSSEEGAKSIVLEMMKLYEFHDCELLVEAPGVRNQQDLELALSLLAERDTAVSATLPNKGTSVDEPTANAKQESTKKRKIIRPLLPPKVSTTELEKPSVVLFGSHDVRVHDNEAFQHAASHGSVIPVFLWSRKLQGKWGVTGAAEVVLKDAIRNLDKTLQKSGLKLICRSTDCFEDELLQLCETSSVGTVYWNTEFTPEAHAREQHTKLKLEANGIKVIECQSSLLYDPTKLNLAGGFNGGHWGTLMPFLKGCKKQLGEPRRPIKRSETFGLLQQTSAPEEWPASTPIDELDMAIITGKQKWDEPILERFPMSEEEAVKCLESFFRRGFDQYEKDRSRADVDHSTSKLSAHLRIGTLSPNELYYATEDTGLAFEQRKTFSRRLFWRDLAYFQLLTFPGMRECSIRTHYDKTEWVTGEEEKRRFEAWKWGKTGYPLVDAGMRELYATGWMTQSVRMVVASFLTEYLRVNWVKGCEWFHYTLVDADSAINAMMWQNAGRSGTDQWNFVVSPVAASQDPSGSYTKKWVPELKKLSKPVLHRPWEAPAEVLKQAGVVLGETYPHRVIVDLAKEREKSVQNVLKMRNENQNFNNDRGYDLITLPNKQQTVVFTKKEYRIDETGKVMKGDFGKKADNSNKLRDDKKSRRKARSGRKKAETSQQHNSSTFWQESLGVKS